MSDIPKKKNRIKKIISNIFTVALAIVTLVTIFITALLVVQIARGQKPSVFGYRFYYILTESMTPELQVNDVILSKVINDTEEVMSLKEGDVITYIASEGPQAGLTITHKVVKLPYFDDQRQKVVVITRGTMFGAYDDPPVPIENIQAIMVRKIGFIGKIYRFTISSKGMITLIIVPLIVIFGLLIMKLIKISKEKQQKALTIEEIARKAVEEYKKQEELNTKPSKKP